MWIKRLACFLVGHAWAEQRYDGGGRRITVVSCRRCGRIDWSHVSVRCRSRAVRRARARALAREWSR